MIPEVKTIYHSMLTRKKFDMNREVPDYALEVVEKYDDLIDLKLTEVENAQLILLAMEENHCSDIQEMPSNGFAKRILKGPGI